MYIPIFNYNSTRGGRRVKKLRLLSFIAELVPQKYAFLRGEKIQYAIVMVKYYVVFRYGYTSKCSYQEVVTVYSLLGNM